MNRPHRGFSLIEIIIVVAIIGLLAAIALSSLNSARTESRDTTRISQGKEIAKAFELFYSEYGVYPQTGDPDNPNSIHDLNNLQTFPPYEGDFFGVYMPTPPSDPVYNYGDAWTGAAGHVSRSDGGGFAYASFNNATFLVASDSVTELI